MFGSIFWLSWLHFGSQVGAQVANKTSGETSADRALRKMTRDATRGAPRRFPDGPKMLFQPSKMAKIEREPTQDELTQDEGEYFSMGEGKGEGKQRCSNPPQDPQRGRIWI